EEVERVVDRQPEAGAPGHEALVHLRRDAHLRDLVEDLRRDGQQADEGRAGAAPEHDLQAPLEGEHLAVEAGRGDDVGEQVLDVVELARLAERVRQRGDLLLEEELLFVVQHGAILAGVVCATSDRSWATYTLLARVRWGWACG